MRFSQKTGCFYPEDIFYAELPDDLIDVSQSGLREQWDAAQMTDCRLLMVELWSFQVPRQILQRF